MFSSTIFDLRHSLALRLTVWYGGIFAASSVLAFALVYALIVSVVQQRTDEDLEDDIMEFASFMQAGGLERVKSEMDFESKGDEAENVFFRLWTSDGERISTTDLASWPGLVEPSGALKEIEGSGEPLLRTLMLPQREHGVRSIYATIGPGVVLEIGETLEEDEEFTGAILTGFLIMLAAVVVLGGPVGWFMARRALRGVEEVTRTATQISGGALDRRVPVRSGRDELDRLAQTFNMMLDRIEALVIGMREMTDNLAHDLRSPLARIRASAEMALANGASGADCQSLAANTTEECDRLLEMSNITLDIAEAESGAAELKVTDIDLAYVVGDACDLFQTVAEDRRLTLTADLPTQCHVQGDLQRLQRVVANLIDNALKYTPPGGRVTVRLTEEDHVAKVSIEDTGVGIPADEIPRIFRRFYRCDRSRSENGNGLGLSLATAFARAHGGDVTATSAPGHGSIFTLVLPRSQENPTVGRTRSESATPARRANIGRRRSYS